MKIIDDGEKKLNEGVKSSSDDVGVVMDTVMLSWVMIDIVMTSHGLHLVILSSQSMYLLSNATPLDNHIHRINHSDSHQSIQSMFVYNSSDVVPVLVWITDTISWYWEVCTRWLCIITDSSLLIMFPALLNIQSCIVGGDRSHSDAHILIFSTLQHQHTGDMIQWSLIMSRLTVI